MDVQPSLDTGKIYSANVGFSSSLVTGTSLRVMDTGKICSANVGYSLSLDTGTSLRVTTYYDIERRLAQVLEF